MKKTVFMIILAVMTANIAVQAQDKPAYTVFAGDGKPSDYGRMLEALSEADVIFIGETHNCPIAHWIEFELTRDL